MPFLGTERPDPADVDHAATKALKKALKMADHAEQMNVEQSTGDFQGNHSTPASRAPGPKLTIAQCPSRLTPFVPPPNYGTVEKGTLFRSGFPQAKHLDFMKLLNIRSLLSLVDTEPSKELQEFLDLQGVQRNHLSIAANKEGGQMDLKTICDAIIFAKEPDNQPVHIHCNQGKHRTGCVVACLRKYQGRPIDEILTEYKAYAYPKERPGDIEFIKAFNPKMVDAYAKCYAHHGVSPKNFRVDSAVDILAFSSSISDDLTPPALSGSPMSSSYGSGSDITLSSPLSPSVENFVTPWTRVRDFGAPSGYNIKHDNEAGICSAEIATPTKISCFDLCDGDSDWEESETVAISATATSPPIAVATRSSFSS